MSLPRKDIRLKVSHDAHVAITVIALADGLLLAEWCERELLKVLRRRVHEASLIAGNCKSLDLSGNGGECENHPSDTSDTEPQP